MSTTTNLQLASGQHQLLQLDPQPGVHRIWQVDAVSSLPCLLEMRGWLTPSTGCLSPGSMTGASQSVSLNVQVFDEVFAAQRRILGVEGTKHGEALLRQVSPRAGRTPDCAPAAG